MNIPPVLRNKGKSSSNSNYMVAQSVGVPDESEIFKEFFGKFVIKKKIHDLQNQLINVHEDEL